jgi:hypothetical protein
MRKHNSRALGLPISKVDWFQFTNGIEHLLCDCLPPPSTSLPSLSAFPWLCQATPAGLRALSVLVPSLEMFFFFFPKLTLASLPHFPFIFLQCRSSFWLSYLKWNPRPHMFYPSLYFKHLHRQPKYVSFHLFTFYTSIYISFLTCAPFVSS